MPRHADENGISTAGGATLREAKELGILTDAIVNGSATVTALKTGIRNAATALNQHGEIEPMIDKIEKSIDSLAAIGDLTDAKVLAATTVAALIAHTASTNEANRVSSVFQ